MKIKLSSSGKNLKTELDVPEASPKKKGTNHATSKSQAALSVLDTTLTVLLASVDGIPVPGLKAVIGGTLAIIKSTKLHSQNEGAIRELEAQLQLLIESVLRPLKIAGDTPIPQQLQSRLVRLIRNWVQNPESEFADMNREVKHISSRRSVTKFLSGGDDALVIHAMNKALKDCLDRFLIEGAITHEIDMNALMIQTQNNLIDKLPRAQARFNSNSRNSASRCFQGTRVLLLRKIYDWIDNTDPKQPRIFWLNGLAGTGKSTVAQTVAEHCYKKKLLGASFFFSRDEADRSNSLLVFSTIAYQLATFNPRFKSLISQALETDPDAGHANFQMQLQTLIVKPLRQLDGSIPTVVVVMDALDECSQEKDVSDILKLLATELRTLVFHLKFFITSRPEHRIRSAFDSQLLRSISQPFILHDIEHTIVQQDIEVYLRHRLSEIGSSMLGRSNWPTAAQLRTLVTRAAGLFIFASTTVRFVEDDNYDDPEGQLNILLEKQGSVDNSSPFDGLDELYSQVLRKALPETAGAVRRERFQTIVGTIVLLLNPLPLSAIERFLRLESGSVRIALMRLYSIMTVPNTDNDVARVVHPSFPDYLTDSRRAGSLYYINPQEHHGRLAILSFKSMIDLLKRDICDIKDSKKCNADIEDLQSRLQTVAPAELRYACEHWAVHVSRSSSDNLTVLNLLQSFTSSHFLYWLELLSLVGQLDVAIPCVKLVQDWLKRARPSRDRQDLLNFLNDAERFVLKFFEPISESALHIYYSALPFVPNETILYHKYADELRNSVALVAGGEHFWDPLLRTMEGHEDQVRSVSFSSDGSRIVSGSWDFSVRVWDSLNGALLATLNGHERDVKAAAFSPDCSHIASASEDETLRLWDVSTGSELAILRGHTRDVTSLAFAPNMEYLVSGSEDATVRIWNWKERNLLATLEGHDHYVRSVNYSPDSSCIVSGSEDSTVKIWNALNGRLLATLSGHTGAVLSVVYFPDSGRIVSGSGDDTLRIWDSTSHLSLAVLTGHLGIVTSVAVSPDGDQIVSGSGDQTVRLWDTTTYALLNTFQGHITTIWSVGFSPDGTRCVSGSGDQTVRLWDTSTKTKPSSMKNLASYVTSVAYSPRGTCIISGSETGILQMWDASTKLHAAAFQAHSREITSLAFTPDGARIASGSGDRTIRLWNTSTRKLLLSLDGHTRLVRSIAFSSDNMRLVSGSEDTTIKIWNSFAGELLLTIDGHSSYVMSVGFSPDGSKVVSGSEDASVRVWHSSTGMPLATLEGHLRDVMGVAFSPSGTTIVSASEDKTLRLWDSETGACLHTLAGHVRDLRAVAFSNDSSRLVTGSEDTTVRLWDAFSGCLLKTLNGHSAYVRSVSFSPDGKLIVSGSEDSTVRVWDTTTFQSQILESHSSGVTCASFSTDDNLVVLGTKDGTVQLWSLTSGSLVTSFVGHERYITSVAFSSDHSQILSGSGDKTVRLWDLSTCSVVRTFEGHSTVITAVAFSVDKSCISSWSGAAGIHWDSQTGQQLEVFRNPDLEKQISYAMTNQWLTYETSGYSHTLWLPSEFRGVVWPSRGSRVLIASQQDKVIIIDFAPVLAKSKS